MPGLLFHRERGKVNRWHVDTIEPGSRLAIPDLHPIQHLTDVTLESTRTLRRRRSNADRGNKIFDCLENTSFHLPEQTLQENGLDFFVIVNLLIGCNLAVPCFRSITFRRLVISSVLVYLLGLAE